MEQANCNVTWKLSNDSTTHNQNYKWPKRDNSAKAGADIPMPKV
jgi:hypothetical protein